MLCYLRSRGHYQSCDDAYCHAASCARVTRGLINMRLTAINDGGNLPVNVVLPARRLVVPIPADVLVPAN